MGEKKMIFLVPYSLFPEFNPVKAEFWESWTRIARIIKKYAGEEFSIEVWKPERFCRYPFSFRVEGVTARIFPSSRWKWLEISPSMLSLLREVKNRENVVFYLHEYHCVAHWLVINLLGDAPIIAQHHGGLPIRRVMNARNSKMRWVVYQIAKNIEENTLRKVDHFFVLTELERKFIMEYIGRPADIQVDPIDFEKFKPMDKLRSRESLGLSPQKIYLLYVGRFLKVRGADIVVKTFDLLRKKHPNLELLMIGGHKEDELYELVINSKGTCLGRIPHDLMPKYFSAVDVVLAPSRIEGVGIVNTLEALACGTPVVTTLTSYLPAHEWDKVGRASSLESFSKDVEFVLENLPFPPERCRRIVQKYCGEEKIAQRTIEVANKLLS